MRRVAAWVLSCVLISVCAGGARAATRYVWSVSPSVAPPYTNWNTAAHDIQSAVNVCAPGDTVRVTNGTYASGGLAVYSNFVNRVAITGAVTVVGVNGPAKTLIVGQFSSVSDPPVRCAYVGAGAWLIGCALTNGDTFGSPYDTVAGQSGGGAWLAAGGALSNCVVSDCRAYWFGHGLFVRTHNSLQMSRRGSQ